MTSIEEMKARIEAAESLEKEYMESDEYDEEQIDRKTEAWGRLRKHARQDLPRMVGIVERLGEALRSLYDEQNGPPLLNRETQWQAAMDEALVLLKEVEAKP